MAVAFLPVRVRDLLAPRAGDALVAAVYATSGEVVDAGGHAGAEVLILVQLVALWEVLVADHAPNALGARVLRRVPEVPGVELQAAEVLDVGAERLVVLLPDPLAQVHLRTHAHREAELVINRVLAEPEVEICAPIVNALPTLVFLLGKEVLSQDPYSREDRIDATERHTKIIFGVARAGIHKLHALQEHRKGQEPNLHCSSVPRPPCPDGKGDP